MGYNHKDNPDVVLNNVHTSHLDELEQLAKHWGKDIHETVDQIILQTWNRLGRNIPDQVSRTGQIVIPPWSAPLGLDRIRRQF
jgi:hypothetical protein